MDVLTRITAERRADAREAQGRVPVDGLLALARRRYHHSLAERLRQPGMHIIAEVKKASPSAGILRPDYQPAAIARAYEAAGAGAVSVLTEPRHFLGCEADLRAVRAAVALPVLRKDFIAEPYQVAEAAAWGADVVLLIMAALDPAERRDLYAEARRLNLDVLAEAHTEAEVEAALALDDAIVGVNSRNLKTLRTDLGVALRLGAILPGRRLAVAESGIRSRADVEALQAVGYRGFLIGETLMRAPDPAAALRGLAGAGASSAA